jgi:hypothetical protein
MRKLFFIIATCFIFFGCKGEDASPEMPETESWFSLHFITEYIVASKIEVEINKESGELCLKVLGDEYKTWNNKEISQEALYFINLYNDDSYYRVVQPGMNRALAYPLDKITICCDKDFDAEHPAGTPLDDIVALRLKTYYDFIKSGYKAYNDNAPNISSALKVRNVNFEDINADNSKLASIELAHNTLSPILFNSAPTELGEYPFTIEMTINGEVLKHSFNFTFE